MLPSTQNLENNKHLTCSWTSERKLSDIPRVYGKLKDGAELLQGNISSWNCFRSPILSSILSDDRFAPFSNLLGIAGTFTEILGVTVISNLAPALNCGFGLLQSDRSLI